MFRETNSDYGGCSTELPPASYNGRAGEDSSEVPALVAMNAVATKKKVGEKGEALWLLGWGHW